MAVVFMSPNGERRRAVEDQMVHQLGEHGIQAVAAESIFEADSAGSPREMQRRFRDAGIDTVMTIRVLDQRAALNPGAPPYEQIPPRFEYLALSRYWGLGWGRVYAPGYLLTDTEVAVETLVYSLSRDDLLWGSRSRHVHKYQILRAPGGAWGLRAEGYGPGGFTRADRAHSSGNEVNDRGRNGGSFRYSR